MPESIERSSSISLPLKASTHSVAKYKLSWVLHPRVSIPSAVSANHASSNDLKKFTPNVRVLLTIDNSREAITLLLTKLRV